MLSDTDVHGDTVGTCYNYHCFCSIHYYQYPCYKYEQCHLPMIGVRGCLFWGVWYHLGPEMVPKNALFSTILT